MRRAGVALAAALGIATSAAATTGCLAVVARPGGTRLAAFEHAQAFRIAYVHSVTRTPVEERYRIDGVDLVQTEIRFSEHGPGLPTASDPGYTFTTTRDAFVVTMQRRFDAIAMRVDADQSPHLIVDGRALDLAAWGNRPLALVTTPSCAPR